MTDRRRINVHTTPNPDGGWDNQQSGRMLSHHRTKEEAEQAAKQEAKQAHTELKIHNRDGKISESISYGNDPFPPRG